MTPAQLLKFINIFKRAWDRAESIGIQTPSNEGQTWQFLLLLIDFLSGRSVFIKMFLRREYIYKRCYLAPLLRCNYAHLQFNCVPLGWFAKSLETPMCWRHETELRRICCLEDNALIINFARCCMLRESTTYKRGNKLWGLRRYKYNRANVLRFTFHQGWEMPCSVDDSTMQIANIEEVQLSSQSLDSQPHQ